jgi:isovaleryl-CoA dehydrogenase
VAQKLDKMGFRGSTTAELVFDECRVPAENLVGEENRGHVVVMSGLDLERAIVAMINLGMAERAFALALDYAKTREQFGKKIGEFQMVLAKLADMYVTVETVRTFCYRILAEANDLESGQGGRGHIHKQTAAALMYAAEGCSRVIYDAVQIFGGAGYMRETEINRLYRATKLLEIGAGTTEVRKLIIAGELMAE